MNRNDTRQAAQVMLAAVEQKPIQFRERTGGPWIDVPDLSGGLLVWDWKTYEYRVAPEALPKEHTDAGKPNGRPVCG